MKKFSLLRVFGHEKRLDKDDLIKRALLFLAEIGIDTVFLEHEDIKPILYYLDEDMFLNKYELNFTFDENEDFKPLKEVEKFKTISFFSEAAVYFTLRIILKDKHFGDLIFRIIGNSVSDEQKDILKNLSYELAFLLDYSELFSLKNDAVDSLIKETQITREKESELSKLKEENKYLKYEQNDFGIIIMDFKLKVLEANSFFKNILGVSDDNFNLNQVLSQNELHTGNFINFLNKISQNGKNVISTVSLMSRAGKELNFKVSGHLLSGDLFFIKLFNITSEVNLTKKYANLKNRFDKMLKAEIEDTVKTSDSVLHETLKFFENKDEDFGNHLERISEYSYVIAKDIFENKIDDEIDGDYLEALPRAAALHDIGMLSIKESILFKDSKLTEEEFEIVKSHTTVAADMIEKLIVKHPTSIFLKLLKEITLGHHERYDGSGYPYGLKEKQIPLSARIVALADIFDGLTTDRIYKKGLELDIARMMMVDYKGKLLDPDLVDIYLKNEDKFIEIFNKYKFL